MTAEQAIIKAVETMELAKTHRRLADELDYKASKYLQGVSTPSTFKKKKSVFTDEQVATLLAKSMKRKTKKPQR